MDGCAILEEFTGAPGTPLVGRSMSAYDRLSKHWKQAWIDNTGAYLDFTGLREEGRMTFSREMTRDGKTSRQRMVFQDISRDRLKWLWQRSDDDGKSWATLWEIDYTRGK